MYGNSVYLPLSYSENLKLLKKEGSKEGRKEEKGRKGKKKERREGGS